MEESRKNIQELVRRAWVVYVATIGGEGFPQVRAVENLKGTERFPHLAELFQAEEFEFATLFSTVTGFNKLKEIEANPKGSIYYCLPKEWRGLRMEGTFEIVTDETIKSQVWHDDWKGFFPSGPLDPKQTIVRACMHGIKPQLSTRRKALNGERQTTNLASLGGVTVVFAQDGKV